MTAFAIDLLTIGFAAGAFFTYRVMGFVVRMVLLRNMGLRR